jgi:hypothetical protein
MANITRTIADSAGFIPQVWAQRALDVLRSNIVLARLVAKDTDYQPGWRGKTLNIPYPGTFTSQSKSSDSDATVQTPTGGASVAVTLSHHEYVDFVIEDFAAAQSTPGLMDRWVEPAAIAIAEAVEDDLFALYSGLSTSVGTTGTDLAPGVIRTARKTLNDAKVPSAGRFGVISTKDEIALLGDSNLVNYFANSRPEAVAQGSIGSLYGFDLYVSQRVPVVDASPDSTKNLFGRGDMFILATRPFEAPEPNSGVAATSNVDPASGLAIRVLHQYDMAARGHRIGFDILYGVAELRDAAGVVVLS